MKISLCNLIILILVAFNMQGVTAQTDASTADTIPIVKPKANQNQYLYYDKGGRDIQFIENRPRRVKVTAGHVLGNIGDGALTLLTGISLGNGQESDWVVKGNITSNDGIPDWEVQLFTRGYENKNRERVREDDGSWSLESNREIFLYWDKDARGIITEGSDTVAFFRIVIDLMSDTVFNKLIGSEKLFPEDHFGIYGLFRGKDFDFFSCGSSFKSFYYSADTLKFVFQPEIEDKIKLKKKILSMPSLILNAKPSDTERSNYVRAAILSRMINNILFY